MKLGDWTFRAFHDGRFKLDGGAMFGVVPQVFWEKKHPAGRAATASTWTCAACSPSRGDRRDPGGHRAWATAGTEKQRRHLRHRAPAPAS